MAREKKEKAKKKRKLSTKVPKEDTGLVCLNCRTEIPGGLNLCPKCGLNPSVQAMTDIYKTGNIKRFQEEGRKENGGE